ncbi:hypothetical protein LCGC14_2142780 [marine sediment metagenome]|uniref:Uncharacterized protein n=1 Tax=marine sediment metagenome TaxID=412755 RepID=A0A0F9GU37_9ZZZZ
MAKTVHRFPKMMYHENGVDTCAVKDAEEKDNLGKEWVDNPVHQFHGCQPPDDYYKSTAKEAIAVVTKVPWPQNPAGSPASDGGGGGETEEKPFGVGAEPTEGEGPPGDDEAGGTKAPTKKGPKKKGK